MTKAFEHITPNGNANLFIFGDHASRYIPDEYGNLGLTGDDLIRHIAWDIGTEDIIRRLCSHFGCAGQIAGVSRLVIDLNRDPDAAGLIPSESDGTIISANQNLSVAARQARIDQYYNPYHEALGRALDQLEDPLVLSVHSFTPKPLTGEQRETDIGLLVKHDFDTAHLFQDHMRKIAPQFNVGINKPYSAYDLNYTVDAHVGPRGFRHLAIELRQDLVGNEGDVARMTKLLIETLEVLA
ncbi:MAG: N-formylglutamate amidohydrolase [Maricaulaceae bacterium]